MDPRFVTKTMHAFLDYPPRLSVLDRQIPPLGRAGLLRLPGWVQAGDRLVRRLKSGRANMRCGEIIRCESRSSTSTTPRVIRTHCVSSSTDCGREGFVEVGRVGRSLAS